MAGNEHVNTAQNVNVVTTAETAIVTLTPVSVNQGATGEGVALSGMLTFTVPTSATAATVRVRQGSGTTGQVVNNPTPVAITVAATNVVAIPFFALDTSAVLVNGAQWTVTLQLTAAAANATVAGFIAADSCNQVE